jgi:nucleotide-binding universal stress UspA family protein
MGWNVHDEDVADAPSRAKPSLALRHRREKLIRMEAALHQQLGPARADQLDGFVGCRFAVWDVDNLYAAQVHGEMLADGVNPVVRADEDWNDHPAAGSLESSRERGLVAGVGHRRDKRRQEVAATLAKAVGGRLSILTVGGHLSGDEVKQLARAERDIGDALDALSDQVLAHAKHDAQLVGVSDVKVQAGWGDPAEVIIETARQQQVDAIVMGRRGRGRLAGLLLGSVSQKVASLAPCVVILVP